MANDLFAEIESLFAEVQEMDRRLNEKYPVLFQTENAASPASAVARGGGESAEYDHVSAANSAFFDEIVDDEPEPEPVGMDDLQAYLLRKKFQQQPVMTDWEAAGRESQETVLRISEVAAQLSDDELFMLTATKLANRSDAEAAELMALMMIRENEAAATRFLPVYTALDSQVSRQRLNQLISRTAKAAQRMTGDEQTLMLLSGEMLTQAVDIVQQAQALIDNGYRNRQEALRKAQEQSRKRYERLRSLL
ncbi:MAG: hypothetical protein IKK75_09190 [Clostridia bacterium]|nr:hypothetical protein [Clostridia bacterium]